MRGSQDTGLGTARGSRAAPTNTVFPLSPPNLFSAPDRNCPWWQLGKPQQLRRGARWGPGLGSRARGMLGPSSDDAAARSQALTDSGL